MKKLLTNNLGLKIASLFIAAFVWVLIINIDDPVVTKQYDDIEVQILNDDVIRATGKTYDIPEGSDVVTVHVKGKQSVFRSLKSSDLEVTADLSALTAEYPSVKLNVTAKRYESQIEDIWTEPETMMVTLDEVASETFPVQVNPIGRPVDGYTIGEMKVEPASVAVAGPSNVLDKISKVTADVNVNGLFEDVVMVASLKLYDEDGEEISADTLTVNQGEKVSISITMLMNKTITLDYDYGGVPADGYELKDASFTPATVTVAGKEEDLDNFNKIVVSETMSEVGINGASESGEKVIEDLSTYLPDNVKLVDEEENILLKYTIDEYGAEPVRIPVDAISVMKPDGFTFAYSDSADLIVTIRGDSEVIGRLTAADLGPSIDLTEYDEAGEYEVVVYFNLPAGCALSDEVTVTVELTEERDDSDGAVEDNGQ